MGFFPTVIETPENKKIVLNGSNYFYAGSECMASKLTLAKEDYREIKDNDLKLSYYYLDESITYFIIDELR